MADYYAMREAWTVVREQATCGYSAEQAAYDEAVPAITFKVYLTGMRQQ
jgi:hypothetical protein